MLGAELLRERSIRTEAATLWELLAASDFREAVEGLGGYDTAEMGLRIR